jgi:hypothetical protein
MGRVLGLRREFQLQVLMQYRFTNAAGLLPFGDRQQLQVSHASIGGIRNWRNSALTRLRLAWGPGRSNWRPIRQRTVKLAFDAYLDEHAIRR